MRSKLSTGAMASVVAEDRAPVVADEQSVVAEGPSAAPYSDSEHGKSDWSLLVEPLQSPREFERFLQNLETSCSRDVLENIMRFADGCLAASLCQRTQYCFLLLSRDWRFTFGAAAVLSAHWRNLFFDDDPLPRIFGEPCHVCNRLSCVQTSLETYYLAEMDLPLQRHRLTVPYGARLKLFERTARYVEAILCYECYELLEAFSGEPGLLHRWRFILSAGPRRFIASEASCRRLIVCDGSHIPRRLFDRFRICRGVVETVLSSGSSS